MTHNPIKINSKIIERGGSIYLLVPPPIRDHYSLKRGLKCKIVPDLHNKIHVTFESE